jgi:hypothetical protein
MERRSDFQSFSLGLGAFDNHAACWAIPGTVNVIYSSFKITEVIIQFCHNQTMMVRTAG